MRKAKIVAQGSMQAVIVHEPGDPEELEEKAEDLEKKGKDEEKEGELKVQDGEEIKKEGEEALKEEITDDERHKEINEAEEKLGAGESEENLVPGGAPPDCDSTLSAIGLSCSSRSGVGAFNVKEEDKSWTLATSDQRVILNGTYTTQLEACAVMDEAEKSSNSHDARYCLKTNSEGKPYFILRNEKKVTIATSIPFSTESARDNAICTVAFFGFFSKKPCACTGETDATQCTGPVKELAVVEDEASAKTKKEENKLEEQEELAEKHADAMDDVDSAGGVAA